MKIGDRLTKLRNKKGFTQDQMADALEVKRARYNSWENNIAKPDIEMITKLAVLHKVSTDYILGMTDSAHPTWEKNDYSKDFKKTLEDGSKVIFNGTPLSDEDKEKIKRVMEAMFWEGDNKE